MRWAVQATHLTDLAHQPVTELSDGQRQRVMIACSGPGAGVYAPR
ncbi:MAG: hypothetical protein R3E79_16005 [Caldilineaceae bacterium]